MKTKAGDTIRVIGSTDGGKARNGQGRPIVKSFTMSVDHVIRGEISGPELRKDGQPIMRGGFIVTRTVTVPDTDDHINDVYEITSHEMDDVISFDESEQAAYESSLAAEIEVPESAVTRAVNTPDILSGDPRRTDTPVQLDGDRFYRPAPWVSKNGKRKNTRAARRRINAKSR